VFQSQKEVAAVSEKILKILLSELTRVRVRCNHEGCGMVYEMPLADLLGRNFENCPICRKALVVERSDEPACHLDNLAKILVGIAKQKNVQVEFVLPDRDEK
jgi:hypothetical protein